MTPPTSPQPPPSGSPNPFPPLSSPFPPAGPRNRFWFFCGRVFLALIGCGGVVSLAKAGFLGAEWLGWAMLGAGCFLLVPLIRLYVYE